MTHSIERHLTRTLSFAILGIGLISGTVSFIFAYQEAREFQDDTLRQIASLADIRKLQEVPAHRATLLPGDAGHSDAANHVMVTLLPADDGHWLSPGLQPGFHTVNSPQGEWRVFIRQSRVDGKIAVSQLTEVRDEVAANSALSTVVPLGLLLLLLALLISKIVRREFSPIHCLTRALDEHPPGQPTTLDDKGLPSEIAPFVRSINGLLRRVARLVDEQRRFIADAAHELRSPLAALSLQVENLKKVSIDAATQERIVPLTAGIERSTRLTEQLLNHARSQWSETVYTKVDLSEWARRVIAEHLSFADRHEIDLGLDDPGDVTLYADSQDLYHVINNALDNALRYTPPLGAVTLRLFRDDGLLTMEVIDSGPGIPEDEYERAFDPFYRCEGVIAEGSGLGLAIAKDAATRLGGIITLHARQDRSGLIFRYQQPL